MAYGRTVAPFKDRTAGLAQFDRDRNADGTLKSWPQWVLDGKPSPTGRYTFSSWKLWKKDDLLQESGLLGPVTLRQTMRLGR